MIRRLFVLGGLTLLLFTAGCGNKGPLYLPQDAAPQAQETTAQSDEKDE